MEDVYIASGVRTAIGRYGGALKSVPAHVLASTVMKEAVRRAGIDAERIDEVILGEVRQSTEASNLARCALPWGRLSGAYSRLYGKQAVCVRHAGGIQRVSGDLAGRSRLYCGGRNGKYEPRACLHPERTLGRRPDDISGFQHRSRDNGPARVCIWDGPEYAEDSGENVAERFGDQP